MTKKTEIKKQRTAVKGLSIATISLSAFSIFVALLGVFFIILAFGLVHVEDLTLNIAGNTPLGYNTTIENENLIIGDTVNNIFDLFNFGLGLILGWTIFSLLASAFSLAISIISLCALSKRKYPENIFVLNIVSAVFSLISVNLIRCAVISVGSYFIYKIKS